MLRLVTVAAVGVAVAVIAIYFYTTQIQPQSQTAVLTLVDHQSVRDEYQPLTLVSGRVVNSGERASNPVTVEIRIVDPNGNSLYTTTTSTQPSIIQPKTEAPFSKQVFDDQLGNYTGQWNYLINVY